MPNALMQLVEDLRVLWEEAKAVFPEAARRLEDASLTPEEQREECLDSIRYQLYCLGISTGHLTNDQLEKRVCKAAQRLGATGPTVDEALESLTRLRGQPRARKRLLTALKHTVEEP